MNTFRLIKSNSDLNPAQVPVVCNPALSCLQNAKSVLLLQGPVGAFFDRLATWLMLCGARVQRVAFQGGDVLDSKLISPILFTQAFDKWPRFFSQQLQSHQIDCVVLFGQSRQYHRVAIELCKKQGIALVVLEEGYFRPGFMTMELNGVNGFSETLTRFTWQPSSGSDQIEADISPVHFQKMAWQASLHYQAMWNARNEFSHYQHHRTGRPSFYLAYWTRSWLRKMQQWIPCIRIQKRLLSDKAVKPYYFVPLQHDGDSQIIHHSAFANNAEFVMRVMRSFAAHAPDERLLVFRQHPQVRGGPGHSELIDGLSRELGIRHRVIYMVEGDTPELAQHSAGVVVINSTVGLQALERGAPLKVMGEAIYKHPQLSFMGELDQFWLQARPACPVVTAQFIAQIKNLTQVPVSVYAMRNEPIAWPTVSRPVEQGKLVVLAGARGATQSQQVPLAAPQKTEIETV